ncbi:MAG: 4-vinyl reductase, partial [Mailhella sp.]
MPQQSKETHYLFRWDKLGDIAVGRQNLGQLVPVQIYRMLEYSLNHVLFEEFGPEKCDEIFRKAGHLAGMEYDRNVL